MTSNGTDMAIYFITLIISMSILYICLSFQIAQQCPCQVNYGGQNMSVEDAFERAGEGLTVDQADEVEILIEEYCNSK